MTVKAKGPGSRHLKLECEHCACIVRMSRAAMGRHGLPSCGCGGGFVPADLAVAVDVGGESLAVRLEAHAVALRSHARGVIAKANEGRQRSGRWQCGGCRQFLRATTETCGCGFTNEIKGSRNYGGYFGMTPDREREADSAIPF